ncbi:MAG: adenylate/guanylate cyclase domain-containing protein [Candidatus Riflebacteria bacterium]|nr:adenylate/guanylate cyclase domain-containing protein [Candidatus Riflebacteria bacterium]
MLAPALRRSRRFRAWVRSWRDPRRALVGEAEDFTGPRWRRDLGRYSLFVRPVTHSPHLAVVLVPREPEVRPPAVLALVNVAWAMGWAGLLAMLALGRPLPVVSLRVRFLGMFGASTGTFLVLAGVVGLAFLQESHEAALRRVRESLLDEIRQVDKRREEMRIAYVAAARRVVRDPEILAGLADRGIAHPRLLARCQALFRYGDSDLPLLGAFFLDLRGQATATVSPGLAQVDDGSLVRFYRNILVTLAREEFQAGTGRPPPGDDPVGPEDRALLRGFAALGSNPSVTTEARERLGVAETLSSRHDLVGKIHDLIIVGGLPRFGFLCLWRSSDLEPAILGSAREAFRQAHPGDFFVVCRQARGRLEPLFPPIAPPPALSSLLIRGRSAPAEGIDPETGRLVVAVPSQSFPDIVFAASAAIAPLQTRKVHLAWLGLGLAAGGGLVALVVGTVVWFRVGPPIGRVRQALAAVSAGDFSPRVALARADEIGLLTRTFDHMIAALEVRRRYARLISGPALDALVAAGGVMPTARRVGLVALVSDIRGFTTLCESQPPAVVTALLEAHFTRMTGVIEAHGGRVDRFIGDAIQAVFEEPLDRTARHPVAAGLAMWRAVEALNRERVAAGTFPYRIGIGLARGEAVMGYVGDPDHRFDLALLGTPLPAAAALEAASKSAPGVPLVMDGAVAEWARAAGIPTRVLAAARPLEAFVIDEAAGPDRPEVDRASPVPPGMAARNAGFVPRKGPTPGGSA